MVDFEAYLIEEELSQNTINSYLFSVNSFFERYDEANKINLVKWKNELVSSLSPKTVNLRLCGMRKYCEFKEIPFAVKQVRVQKTTSVENVMTIEQFNTLINGLKRDNETKWIVVPCDDDGIIPNDIEIPTDNEIYAQISFQEQFFCGVIVK